MRRTFIPTGLLDAGVHLFDRLDILIYFNRLNYLGCFNFILRSDFALRHRRHHRRRATVGNRRLAKPHSNRPKFGEVTVGKIGKTLPEVLDRLSHPMVLVVRRCGKNPAAVDMTKQLIASCCKKLLSWHVASLNYSYGRPDEDLPSIQINSSHQV